MKIQGSSNQEDPELGEGNFEEGPLGQFMQSIWGMRRGRKDCISVVKDN